MSPSSFIHYSPQELLRLRAGVGTVHTVFLARELWEPHKRVNWRGLCAEPIVACWLAAREREVNYSLNGYTEERNCWVIVLELAARRSATVELRQADTAGNTITVCRPGPVPNVTSRVSRKGSPIDLLEGYACSFRLGLVVRRTVGDWLDTLQRSGLTGYALECGRGQRYWVRAVVRQFKDVILGRARNLEQSEMAHVWELGDEVDPPKANGSGTNGTGCDGFQPGRFIPSKALTKLDVPRTNAPELIPTGHEKRGQYSEHPPHTLLELSTDLSPESQTETEGSRPSPSPPIRRFYPYQGPEEPYYGVGIEAWLRFAKAHGA